MKNVACYFTFWFDAPTMQVYQKAIFAEWAEQAFL